MHCWRACLRTLVGPLIAGALYVPPHLALAAGPPEPSSVGGVSAQAVGKWSPLRNDGLHDPQNPVLPMLQEPGDALSRLPPFPDGNQVDWIRALQKGVIQPRSSLRGDAEGELRDTEVLLKHTGNMPYVLFPHKPHTEWLHCENCHEELFRTEGKTPGLKMLAILQGEFCGRCHGAVAFPLTGCNRCHSVRPQVPSAFESIPDQLSK